MEFLPEELLVNILTRLPLKVILRFKIVCKSWLKLISSSGPYFTSNYVRNSPFSLIIRVTRSSVDPKSFSLLEFAGKGGGEYTHHTSIKTPKIPDHQGSDSSLYIIGSCDCSVFMLQLKYLADHVIYRVYMFNLILGSCIKVAEDRFWKWEPMNREYKVGFIPSNSTYKLVRFVPHPEKAKKPEIFTVGGLDIENWRNIVDDDGPLLFCGGYPFYKQVICFNGYFHWISGEHDGDRIFTFDLLEEKSGTRIPKPRGVSQLLSRYRTRVTIINDRLSLTDVSGDYSTVVIWSMREYGVVESWSRVFVLPLCVDRHPSKWRYYYYHVPIAVLANGDILFVEEFHRVGEWFYILKEKRLTQIAP